MKTLGLLGEHLAGGLGIMNPRDKKKKKLALSARGSSRSKAPRRGHAGPSVRADVEAEGPFEQALALAPDEAHASLLLKRHAETAGIW
jgi:hypothetical protein